MIQAILFSNVAHLVASAALGGLAFVVSSRFLPALAVFAYGIAGGILISGLFGIGEVYVYSDLYMRAFFYYSDQITTILAFFLLYAFVKRDLILVLLTGTAVFLSGGKVSMVLFAVMATAFFWINRNEYRKLLGEFAMYLLGGVAGYVVVVGIVLHLDIPRLVHEKLESAAQVEQSHRGACPTVTKCVETQIMNALRQRAFSTAAGLWMTLEGGFGGDRYPSSRERFADLMISSNPWGINDRYGLTWDDWRRIGSVQNPYAAFGAGYGPWLLGVLLCAFLSIGALAVLALKRGARDEGSLFAIFFLVNAGLNQTQSWLHAWSPLLVLTGFCATYVIVYVLLLRSGKLSDRLALLLPGLPPAPVRRQT